MEKAERGKKAQLAYSFDIALQNEFSMQENIGLARQFLLEQFVSRGMVVDFSVHAPDKGDGGITKMFELLPKLSAAIQTKQQFEEQGEASPEAPAAADEDEQDMEL